MVHIDKLQIANPIYTRASKSSLSLSTLTFWDFETDLKFETQGSSKRDDLWEAVNLGST